MKRFALLPLLLSLALAAAAQDTNDYVLRSDLAAYAERADLDSYATHETLSNYSLTSDLSAYATLADLAGLASLSDLSAYPTLSSLGAEIAAYLSSNPPAATAAILTNYALRSDLTAYATLSALAGYVSADSLTNYPTRSELSAYATASDLDGLATSDDLSGYALLSALPAEIASYLATNPPTVSAAILTNYALRSDLSAYAPLSALAGFLTSSNLSDYVLASDLSAYATASDLAGFATDEDIADFATLSNLYSAVSSALSSVSNSFLGAYSSTSGSNTYWHVPVPTDFEEETSILGGLYVEHLATFADGLTSDSDSTFTSPVAFEDSVTFGGETRTNFPGPRERIVYGGESAWITADDGLVWTTPDESDAWIYLEAVTNAAGRAVTVVIRNTSDDDSVVTRIYDVTSGVPQLFHTLTLTNPIAVFDWCSSCDAWIAR